ncbi:MAG: MFS transporter [Paracoccaceae bacterium]
MLSLLKTPVFRHLFAAQALALVGTGLATVALGLLAFRIGGEDAGLILGTALAIKMIAYVTLAPFAAALAARLPRRAFLVGLDCVRAAVVAALPFVTEVWQIYVLIFLLQAASAAFTPAFQAAIPDIFPGERDYTRALSLLRLTEDMEQIASPLLAAALLSVVGFPVLFAGTVAGFAASALLVGTADVPPRPEGPGERFLAAASAGVRIYLRTPRLRGALALEFATAAAGAIVYVNTVVFVEGRFGSGEPQVALAFAAFGGGSMLAALALPRLLETVGDRRAMIAGAALMLAGVAASAAATGLPSLAALWAAVGFGFAMTQVPVGRILTRSARAEDRPAVFAAQFALSHAAWLFAYPLAGWLGASAGLPFAGLALAALGGTALIATLRLWPAHDPEAVAHAHPDLPPGHPHLAGDGAAHAHPFVIDRLHRRWPRAGGRA